MKSLSRNTKIALGLYLTFLTIYFSTAGNRLLKQSSDTHFLYQAQMFLQQRLDLGMKAPPNMNDWAEVEYLTLKDGRTIAGAFLKAQPSKFRLLGGKFENVEQDAIESRTKKYYVSFPPFPAVIFLPLVAIMGMQVNDVIVTILLAGLVPALLFLILRRLAARGDSQRNEEEDLWLVGMFGIGSVYYYSSIMGQVWYTAHIVSNVLVVAMILAALDGKRPVLAATFLGAMVLTRPQMLFWGILILFELVRVGQLNVKNLAKMAVPLTLFAIAGAAFNYARFGAVAEFGHSFLNVRWTDRIQRYGLFNYAFIARNLSVAFTLTPKLTAKAPYVLISWHGVSLWFTTPSLIYLLWPERKTGLHTALWLVAAPIALLGFMYQNDGWVQFGYRFSLDFLIALVMLLAIGGRSMTKTWKALIVLGVLVNLFGAITFNRMWNFYHEGFFPISAGEL